MRSREMHRGWRYPRITTGAIATWIATVLLAPPSGNGWTAVVNGLAVLVLVIVVGVNVWCWFKDRKMASTAVTSPLTARLGAAIGNWNDRISRHDTAYEASLRWRIIDRLAHWLYVRGGR